MSLSTKFYRPMREDHFPKTQRGGTRGMHTRVQAEGRSTPMQDWVEERSGRKCHKDDAMLEMYRLSGGPVSDTF